MDICVVTYRNTVDRIIPAMRKVDRLIVRDNTDDNIGFAAGANRAAALGDDALVVFVNPDGDPSDDCFQQLEDAMADDRIVAVEASQGPVWDPPLLTEEGDLDYVSAACMAVRRAAFEAVGGFDERLFMYGEDIDLSYKLRRIGRLRRVAGAQFAHDSGPRSFRALHRYYRNWLVVQRRHHRSPSLERMLRDAIYTAHGQREWREAAARVTGMSDYLLRGQRWV